MSYRRYNDSLIKVILVDNVIAIHFFYELSLERFNEFFQIKCFLWSASKLNLFVIVLGPNKENKTSFQKNKKKNI